MKLSATTVLEHLSLKITKLESVKKLQMFVLKHLSLVGAIFLTYFLQSYFWSSFFWVVLHIGNAHKKLIINADANCSSESLSAV